MQKMRVSYHVYLRKGTRITDEQMMPPTTADVPEQSTTPANDIPPSLVVSRTEIHVVGAVQLPQDSKGKHRDLRVSQGAFRTRTTRLLLHVAEEDGSAYGLNVDVPSHTAEREQLLARLKHGERVRVRGTLRTEPTFDLRFATDDNPAGRPTRQMAVVVEHIDLADADAIDGTWLKLTGRTSAVADIRDHEYGNDDQVGRTFVVVEWSEPSQRPGSRITHTRSDRIPLDVPLALPGSTNALRGGNLITVEGQLEPFQRYIDPERNSAVNTYLTSFNTRRQTEYAALSPQERQRQERRDRRTLQHIRYEQSLRVRAGYIELHDGEPMNIEEAQEVRAAWVKQRKQRKQRNQGNDVPKTMQHAAAAHVDQSPSHSIEDVRDVQEQGNRPVRHRRVPVREHDGSVMIASASEQETALSHCHATE